MKHSTPSTSAPLLAVALAIAVMPGSAFARGGGHGGGHMSGGHGAIGHSGAGGGFAAPTFGASGLHASGAFGGAGVLVVGSRPFESETAEPLRLPAPDDGGFAGFGRVGGYYGGYLYVGPDTTWNDPHWGSGYWAAGAEGWAWYTGRWWVSPAYPGWVWIGPPWVSDGERFLAEEGYWTTAGIPEGTSPPAFVDSPSE